MSVSQSAPQLNPPRPVMPNVNYPRPASPVAGQPLAAPVNRPPSAGDPARPPIRPPPMTGPVPPATRPPAAWRNPTPVAAAQAYPAPASSTTFYTPGRDYDSDDDSLDISSMMSGVRCHPLYRSLAFLCLIVLICVQMLSCIYKIQEKNRSLEARG